jgi:hypothetical protein
MIQTHLFDKARVEVAEFPAKNGFALHVGESLRHAEGRLLPRVNKQHVVVTTNIERIYLMKHIYCKNNNRTLQTRTLQFETSAYEGHN